MGREAAVADQARRFLVIATLGYGLQMALVSVGGWLTSSSAFSTTLSSSGLYAPFTQTKNAFFCLTFFVWFVVAMRGGGRLHRAMASPLMCWPFAVVFALGGMVGLVSFPPDVAPLLESVCGLLMGVGLAGNFVMWVSLISSRETPADARVVVMGTLVGGVLYFVLSRLPAQAICLISIASVAPASALALMYCGFRLQPAYCPRGAFSSVCDAAKSPSADAQCLLYGGVVRYPFEVRARWANLKKGVISLLAPCLVIGAIGAVVQLTRLVFGGVGMDSVLLEDVNGLSLVVAPILTMIFFERGGYHIDMGVFYRVCAPVIGMAILGLPVLGELYGYLFSFLAYTIFSFASMVGIIACTQVSRHYHVPPIAMYALVFGVIYTMRYIPTLAIGGVYAIMGVPLGSLLPGHALLACGFVCLALMFAVYVASDRYRSTQEIAEVYSWESEMTPRYRQVAEMTSAALADLGESNGLTGREIEVLELLTKGRTASVIASQLGVSQNTVRFHCRNIYGKFAVHGKQELLVAVERLLGDSDEAGVGWRG